MYYLIIIHYLISISVNFFSLIKKLKKSIIKFIIILLFVVIFMSEKNVCGICVKFFEKKDMVQDKQVPTIYYCNGCNKIIESYKTKRSQFRIKN